MPRRFHCPRNAHRIRTWTIYQLIKDGPARREGRKQGRTHPGRRDRGAARRRFGVTAKRDGNAAKLTGYIDRILVEAKPLTDEQPTGSAGCRHRDDRFRQPKGLITADASAAISKTIDSPFGHTCRPKFGPPIAHSTQGFYRIGLPLGRRYVVGRVPASCDVVTLKRLMGAPDTRVVW